MTKKKNISPLENKIILLGVTGSIAAYKSADLASSLVKLGANVHVLMTSSALNSRELLIIKYFMIYGQKKMII